MVSFVAMSTVEMIPTRPLHKHGANAYRPIRMNRRKADFKFAYKFLEDDL